MIKGLIGNLIVWFSGSPTKRDVTFLTLFIIFCTFNPFYLNRPVNLFELGLYLPGINAILDGLFPFRDFFHLRGPLEIWFPAVLMQIFGEHMSVLTLYFYVGNVACLVLLLLIAKELLVSRVILYAMVPVIVARTFPRIVYMIWGGMRYALGLVAILILIKAFKNRRLSWFFSGGVLTVIASLVSIEMGIYVFLGFMVALIATFFTNLYERTLLFKVAASYLLGCSLIAVSFVVFMASNNALTPYLEATYTVVFELQEVVNVHTVSIFPSNFVEALMAMFNPVSVNFKHMTPSYLYLCLLAYLIWRLRQKVFSVVDVCLVMLGIYGFVMYNTGFRSLWAAQFEMALMPEKVLYFVLLEIMLLWLWQKRAEFNIGYKRIIQVMFVVIFISSIGYALARFNHRFFVFQYIGKTLTGKSTEKLKYFSHDEPYLPLSFHRAKGINVPATQAKDLELSMQFIEENTKPNEEIIFYPELGIYSYFADRPFLGRFPLHTLSWFKESWYQEFKNDFLNSKAKYLFLSKKMPDDWYTVYFAYPPNKRRFEETNALIELNYQRIGETPLSWIYQRK